MDPTERSLVHDPEYEREYSRIERHTTYARVLGGLIHHIAAKPEEFDVVPGFDGVRIAKSDSYQTIDGVIGRMRIWFRIANENQILMLRLHTEEPCQDC